MSVSVPRAKHLPALDGLRAVAVFVVISYHAGLMKGIPGDLGVTLFFVLSGFLITWLLLREFAATGSISIRSFYARRALRIFPAYYVFILFSLAVDTALGHRWSRGLIAVAFTYLVNYYNAFNGHPITSIAHAWSLAVEEQFYLLWPLACLSLLRRSRASAARAVALVIVATVAWRSVLYLLLHAPASYVYNAFDTRCDSLAIGCLIALSLESHWFRAMQRRIQASALLPLVTLGLILDFAPLRIRSLSLQHWDDTRCRTACRVHDPDARTLRAATLGVARSSNRALARDSSRTPATSITSGGSPQEIDCCRMGRRSSDVCRGIRSNAVLRVWVVSNNRASISRDEGSLFFVAAPHGRRVLAIPGL